MPSRTFSGPGVNRPSALLRLAAALLAFCAVALLATAGPASFVGVARAEVAVPPLTARVMDLANVLSPGQRGSLEGALKAFEESKGAQLVVLTVPTVEPETVEQFGIRVADAWKVGRRGVDDGAILLLALKEREVRIEVGYGLEGVLTDAMSKRIISEQIIPRAKNGDLAGGILAGMQAMMEVVKGEPLPPPKSSGRAAGKSNRSRTSDPTIGMFFIGALIGGAILTAVLGRLLGSFAAGIAVGFVTWFLSSLLVLGIVGGVAGFILALIASSAGFGSGRGISTGGFRRGGFGGLGGGGFGGGGFGGGGFGGGGGGFGGGGASGKW